MRIHFPEELPVSARREEIAEAIAGHQVVVVAGETGSGKTTQLPKIALQLGRGETGKIGHTQPRRIAASSVAQRIADELEVSLGDEVGYQVRFDDRTGSQTRVKVMTDGILLAELQHDRELRGYDTLIIDEAHERSLNIDFLLGYLKRLLPRRPDLKLVITSATIDPERFAEHFAGSEGPAPIIDVSGRTYPVELRYRPLVDDSFDEDGELVVRDQTEAIVASCQELVREGPGDILVFLPGEREIRDAAEALAGAVRQSTEIVPLFSRLSGAEQRRVFAPHSGRRIVLATNVAETSLTVPGIRYVVDTGLARISRYSVRTKVQRLPIEPVSQASARQRAGRCGRVAPGICIRLYAEENYDARPEFTDPEILRTNLASVILQMSALRLGDVARFPFVDAPDQRNVRAGVQLLEELGALSPGKGRLTRVGRHLAQLPIDPRLGRMVLEADRLGVLRQVLVVVAALSIQDPRERPAEQRAHADQLHARFRDESSDFLAWLKLWDYLRARQRELSGNAFRRLCREEHLNFLRVREWQQLEAEIRRTTRGMGLKSGKEIPAEQVHRDRVHRALLAGLLSHIGLREEVGKQSGARGQARSGGQGARRAPREYLGARNTRFAIFPGSGLRKPPEFVMAAELVETSRLFARQVAGVDPAWAESLAGSLAKRSYSEPHWSRKRAAVMARERVTLYGVPLAADRPVNYARHDPEVARELFIRHALVYGEWDTRHRFFHRNRQLLAEAEDLEHRARRRGIVVDEHTLFDFYDARIGAEVVSGAHFDTWWKRTRHDQPDLLSFDPEMLVHDGEAVSEQDYPELWQVGPGQDLSVGYRFEPGHEHDGMTVDVPLATLNRLGPETFSWQVPGMRHELVTALLRSLPKRLRVNFVPAPDYARDFLRDVPPGEEDLPAALSRYLLSRTGVVVAPEAWNLGALPVHLRPRFRILGEEGEELTSGRDLAALKEPLRASVEAAVAEVAASSGLATSGATTWTFGAIERSFTQVRAGHEVSGYPTLVDEGDTVGLRIVSTEDEQAARHRLGVRRLAALNLPDPTREVVSSLDNAAKLMLSASPYPNVAALVRDCVLAVIGEAVDAADPVRDEASFDVLVASLRPVLGQRVRGLVAEVVPVLDRWRDVQRTLGGRLEINQLAARTDLTAQFDRLFSTGFVADSGPAALRRYPTYLAAMRERVEALGDIGRDRQLMDRIADLQDAWLHRVQALPPDRPVGPGLRRVRWLLEEYRVSLWAQHLGTSETVSDRRVRNALDAAGPG